MQGITPDLGFSGIVFTAILQIIFLGICVVFVGRAVSEIKKRKNIFGNIVLFAMAIGLALVSFYATFLFLQY